MASSNISSAGRWSIFVEHVSGTHCDIHILKPLAKYLLNFETTLAASTLPESRPHLLLKKGLLPACTYPSMRFGPLEDEFGDQCVEAIGA